VIFINFKAYEKGTGEKALILVKILEAVASKFQVKIIPVVQATDIKEMVLTTKLEVWAQKIDPIAYGAHTGAILPEAVIEDGAQGTFLNHSEAKLNHFEDLALAVKRCAELELKTLVFSQSLAELKKTLDLKPTFVAYEPPELIASRTTSVAQARSEAIKTAVNLAREKGLPLVVGAGIKSGEDTRKSLELGAVGVVVASDVMLAKNPEKELLELVQGFS